MKKTGELLRLAREARGISIHEVSVALKINSRILTSIEAGETQGLPAKTFLRGFVHSYASFVKADVTAVMAAFSEEMGAPAPTPLTNMPTPSEVNATATAAASSAPASEPVKAPVVEKPVEKVERPNRSQTPLTDPFTAKKKAGKNFIWYAAGLILIFASLITKRLVDKYQKESVPAEVAVVAPIPKPPESEPQKPAASLTDTTAPFSPRPMPIETLAAGTTEAKPAEAKPTETKPLDLKPTEKPVEKVVEKPVEKPAPIVAAPPPPPVTPVVKAPAPPPPPPPPAPKKEEPPKEVAKETPKPAEAKPASETPAAPKGKKVSLLIEATDSVTVEYKSATGETKTMTLAADQVVSINGTSGLELKLSNGGAANITVNGRDLGVAGDSGKPTVLKY